jgi:hypothetical protein
MGAQATPFVSARCGCVAHLELEHAFAAAEGRLLSGSYPTGPAVVLPGFGDRREIELPVEAGVSGAETIKIGTLKEAVCLGKEKQIGSIAPG